MKAVTMRFLRISLIYALIASILAGSLVAGLVFLIQWDEAAAALSGILATVSGLILFWLLLTLYLTRSTREPGIDPETLLRQKGAEKVLHREPAIWIKRLRLRPGFLVLTTQRILFIPHRQHRQAIHTTLDNIRSVRRLRLLFLLQLGLTIQRHDRESESLVLEDEPTWHEKINHARRARRPVWINSGTVEPP